MSAPITFPNTVNEFAALILVRAPSFLATCSHPQLDSLAYLFLRLHGEGIGVVDVTGQILALGELPIIVWLVYPGAREDPAQAV